MKLIYTIGLMSGTSMDGIDGSLIHTNGKDITKNIFSASSKYSFETLNLLDKVTSSQSEIFTKSKEWKILNKLVTNDHAFLIKKIIKNSQITPKLIGFHGQTIYHNPKNKTSIQIGYPELLKKKFGITIVSKYRENDLLAGGQGAPLAPIYHKSLMKKLNLDLPACFVNIGGVSNITYWDGNTLIGFDTGPGNALMDKYMKKYLNLEYDPYGSFASLGKISFNLVKYFMDDEYFTKQHPKSLDNQYFSRFLNNLDFMKLKINDALATLNFITAKTIIDSMEHLPKQPKSLTIMGGGQYNDYLVETISKNSNTKVQKSENLNINAQMIESELIGYLAVRKFYKLPSTFPSTTGAKKPTVCGKLF